LTDTPPAVLRVLIAPDKFKGSLTAAEAARAVGSGMRRVRADAEVREVPVADGGDGTLAAAVAAGYVAVPVTVAGPTGEPVRTSYARRGERAVVELADACGLVRLPGGQPAPLSASSRGAGEVIAAAVRAGCREIVLGIGGSASTDGGAGLLRGLGAAVRDAGGRDLPEGGAALTCAATIDLDPVRVLLTGVRVTVACDVDNPLTGAHGAAAVYGPQKGATPRQVAELDAALGRWADLIGAATGTDQHNAQGAGAAGGVGYAARAVLGATLRPGIDLVLDLVDFPTYLADADLVITGEGALDTQSLRGKAPVGVAAAARVAGVPVVAVCGRTSLSERDLSRAGIVAAYPLTDLEPDPRRCMTHAASLLEQLGAHIAGTRLEAATG
jgi:glycerate 2-kinase